MAPLRIMLQLLWLTLARVLFVQCHPVQHQHDGRGILEAADLRGIQVTPFLPYSTPVPAKRAQAPIPVTSAPPPVFGPSDVVSVSTSVARTGIVQVLPPLTNHAPATTGSIVTALDPAGGQSKMPLIVTSIATPTTMLKPAPVVSEGPGYAGPLLKAAAAASTPANPDIFTGAIGTKPPAGMVVKPDHPVPRLGVQGHSPVQTNKFFSNFYLGDQRGPSYVYPYAVNWAGGTGQTGSYGLAISHVDAQRRVLGPQKNGFASYYINPVGIQYLAISAKELGRATVLTMDTNTAFSATVSLRQSSEAQPLVSFPLVQGSAFVTSIFNGGTPVIQTGVFFRTVTRVTTNPKNGVVKFNILLEDGSIWHIYAWSTSGVPLSLNVLNNGYAQASGAFRGIIQVCKDPGGDAEKLYDNAAGVYATDMSLSGSVMQTKGTYSFNYKQAGHPAGQLVMFALPHHVASFDTDTSSRLTRVRMQTPTKGVAVAVTGVKWTMSENMPLSMAFAPWSTTKGSVSRLSDKAKTAIATVAQSEVSQDMQAQTNLDSMYFSGKALVKFAQIVYVLYTTVGNKALAQAGLEQLKIAFARFSRYQNKYPLVYERGWGGIVSSATYATGDSGLDFGNTYYNDHHFHYGYHILAAAYIGYMDSTWIEANRDYVNGLVRDIANPSTDDPAFPVYRSFDWYHGHSWAHGLYPAADGKDQESSSEDIMSAYALKMWGTISGDLKMASRGNLQLAITARSLQNYYLMTKDNKVQPPEFIGNKVAGIIFENKADHTTYFDSSIEAVQGIHMIPIIPPSSFVRTPTFVQEEWDTYFSQGRVDKIQNLWKGIIYANYAIVNPQAAWNFFSQRNFDMAWIDGGASLAWYMAYSASLGGL